MAALPPLGGPPPSMSSLRGKNERTGSLQSPADRAMASERDAGRQIAHAEQSIEEARRTADTQIDQIHDQYEHRSEAEYARSEDAIEKQKIKGYEQLRDLQRNQQAEINRVRTEGERDLHKLQTYYRDTIYGTEQGGNAKLHDLEMQQGRMLEHERATKDDDVAAAQAMYRSQYDETRENNEANLQKLRETTLQDYDRIRTNSTDANEKAEQSFEQKFQGRLKEHDQVIVDLDNRAADSIREVRRDTSQKLAAYSSRQRDPFYRMLDLNVNVHDRGDYYELTASIPEHEQKHVAVAVKGSQLVLSGYRRNEEKLELEPGRSQGTNSYQSFLETFPIEWPVDANRMTREFDGDRLVVRVPKKGDYAYHSQAQSKVDVPRARLERPKFPENLPIVKRDPSADDPQTPNPGGKRKGSGTLG